MIRQLSSLSVFFPLYNEEESVQILVKNALAVIPQLAKKYEIILVNDGSTDNTLAIAQNISKIHSSVRVVSQKNMGYGGALKTGFKEAKYQWVFFSDGDLQFDISELERFIQYSKKFDLVIGYRKTRAEGFKRLAIAKLLKIWNLFFFGFPLSIKDADCAFKLIRKKILNNLAPLKSNGGLISTEFLLKAILGDYKIKQLPVTHKKRLHGISTGDSAKVIKTAIIETWELLKLFPKRMAFLIVGAAIFTLLIILGSSFVLLIF